jgi:gas vesicle protein
MRRHDVDADEPVIVIEERSSDIGPFLVGALVGAGIALLMAPRSGSETRSVLRRRVRSAGQAARNRAGSVAHKVTDTFTEAKEELERRIESARAAVTQRSQQLTEAVSAGRTAARDARGELRARLAEARSLRRTQAAGGSPPARPVDTREGRTPGTSQGGSGTSGRAEG